MSVAVGVGTVLGEAAVVVQLQDAVHYHGNVGHGDAAVGVGVAALDGQGDEVLGIDADGHVLVGHGERCAVERTCTGDVAVLVAFGCAGGGVGEGEAELVAAAVVEGSLVVDGALQSAVSIGGDAADVVLSLSAGEGDVADGDVCARRDGAHGLALGSAEGGGVVAVGGRAIPVAHEGGAGRAAIGGVDADAFLSKPGAFLSKPAAF